MTATETHDSLRARAHAELAIQLPEHVGRLAWDASRLRTHQQARLRALLAVAVERSAFHARRLRGIGIDAIDPDGLDALPVMTKTQMMADFDDVVTDGRLTRALVEDHLAASTHDASLLLDEYVCLASGGSSGERGVIVQTLAEYITFSASVVRRAVARLQDMFGENPPQLVIALVGATSPVHSTGFGAATSSGAVRVESVPVTLPVGEIVARLNELQAPALMGYPSKLAQLAHEQRAGRLQIAPFAVTTTSEWLTREDRDTITEAFGVPVVDQFGSTEGLVGHSDPGDSVLTFASDVCIVELVDEANRPVAAGTRSAKVLVTNLHNFTQPLIRYELTDCFVRQPDAPDHGHLRAEVEGRADQVFRYGDVELHPLVVRTALVKVKTVVEYQVRQTPAGVDVDAVVTGELNAAALALALQDGLRDAGLADPRATVRIVDAIARHPETGKVCRFVPLAATDAPRGQQAGFSQL